MSGPGETVYGVHPVREVLRRGRRPARRLLLARSRKDPVIREILALARERGVPVEEVTKGEVERLAPGGNHQGVCLLTDELAVLPLPDALAAVEAGPASIWVALDQITDPHNLGAIIRNAAAFGASAILLPERRSAPVTPLVQKIASGAAEYVEVVNAGNLNQALRRMKDAGFWVYGAAGEGRPVGEVPLNGPALLLIGAEGAGIRKKTRELCDELVAIPQAPGGVASLNASCAAAVLLFDFSRRLGTLG